MQDVPRADTTHIEIEETGHLIASDKVEGTAVYDRAGRHLGDIHNVMIDKASGQVRYAVMSFGGFLGIGSAYHPLPWRELKYDRALEGYVVDINTARLTDAPSYSKEQLPPWEEPGFGKRIDDYYGVM